MPTLENLRSGVHGSLSFTHNGESAIFEHARLQFDHEKGGRLEVPLDGLYQQGLTEVNFLSRSDYFYLPNLIYRSADHKEKWQRHEFVFDEILMGHGPTKPQAAQFYRVAFTVEHMRYYFGTNTIHHLTPIGEPEQLHAFKHTIVQESAPEWQAEMFVEAEGRITPQSDFGYRVSPVFSVGLLFQECHTFATASQKLFQLSTFWEFMTQRSVSPTRVTYRNPTSLSTMLYLSKAPPAASFDIHWFSAQAQAHWDLCSSWVGPLFRRWTTLDPKSPWMDNFVRLVNHSNLPPDVRFIMAYTALQGFGQELAMARPLTEQLNEKDRVWNDFKQYWMIGLGRSDEEARQYTDKLVVSRHHFAHLSKTGEDILKTPSEYAIAYLHIMNTIKAMFLRAVGVPEPRWQEVLGIWGRNVQRNEHSSQ